jgi:hypothetical protein
MMKKTVFLLLALFGLLMPGWAKEYVVLAVRGEAARSSDGQALQPGDALADDDALALGEGAMLALCSPEAGRFLIASESGASGTVADLAKPGTASVKADAPAKFATDVSFAAYFSPKASEPFYRGHFVVIGDMAWYKVDAAKYPLDGNQFFFVRYVYNDISVNKGLPFDREEFALERQEIYSSSGRMVVENQDLIANGEFLYYNGKEYRLLCEFKPYFLEEDELKQSVSAMKPWLQARPTFAAAVQEVQAFIADMYGKAGKGDVEKFLRQHFPELVK